MPSKLFKPMLAAKPDPSAVDAELARLPFPALFSPKLDGVRAMVQNGRLYTRNLKLVPNLEMQKLWGCEELDDLDGEIIVGSPTAEDCFNRTSSVVRAVGKSAEGATFYVFDKFGTDSFEERLQHAKEAVEGACVGQTTKLVQHVSLHSFASLAKYEARQLALGYEGVMYRRPGGCYKQGRSTLREGGLVAVKRFVDAEAVVLATYEQEANNNVKMMNELGQMRRSSHKSGKSGKETLGGFVVTMLESKEPNKRELELAVELGKSAEARAAMDAFNIGTGVGLTDAVRKTLWKQRATLPGRIIKFRYQKVGTKDAPRIPVFLGFRDLNDL